MSEAKLIKLSVGALVVMRVPIIVTFIFYCEHNAAKFAIAEAFRLQSDIKNAYTCAFHIRTKKLPFVPIATLA